MSRKPTKKQLKSNIWKYAVFLITNKRVFVAILGAYYLTVPGVEAAQIGIILLAGSLAAFVLEVPSGYISDKLGHKQTLVFSRVSMLLSTLFFLIGGNLLMLILGGVFLSMGFAFMSGTGSVFMHETLRGLNREKDYTVVIGKLKSVGFAVPIVFMVLVPFLVDISFKLPFVIGIVFDVIGIIAVASFVVPPVSREDVHRIKATRFKEVVREAYSFGFYKFAVLGAVIAGIAFAVSGFRAPYQVLLEIPVIYFGVLFGIGRGMAALLLAYSGRLKKYLTLYSYWALRLGLFAVLILALVIVDDPWMIVGVFIIINALQHGMSALGLGFWMEIIGTSKFKATLLSIRALLAKLSQAVAVGFLGFLIAGTSYQYGFLVIGSILVVLGVPLYVYILRSRNKISH